MAVPEGKEAYHLEIDDSGCSTCKHGRTWIIIGPDEIGGSTSYGSEEEAEDICELMNEAYEKGRKSVNG